MRTHDWIDRRSLALDQRIAKKLRRQPELLQQASATLNRWLEQRNPNPPGILLEWRKILQDCSLSQIIELLESNTEQARRLRQSSPFCGILTPQERLSVFREYETSRT